MSANTSIGLLPNPGGSHSVRAELAARRAEPDNTFRHASVRVFGRCACERMGTAAGSHSG